MKALCALLAFLLAGIPLNVCAQTQEEARLLANTQIQGKAVSNLQDEIVGSIDGLLLAPGSGQVRFAILSVGGFLGIADTLVPVPWSAFRVTVVKDQTTFVLDATRQRLEKAPRLNAEKFNRLSDHSMAEPILAYWGVPWTDS